jgi:hypothetical protein
VYFGAGVLRQSDLRVVNQMRWKEFRASADDVDAGLEGWEDRLYSSVLQPGDRVLMLGSGGCRDLIPLCVRGHDVTGVEQVPELNALAREHMSRHGVTATLLTGAAETVELQGVYDVVIFSSFTYGYLMGSSTRAATLARLRNHLARDGQVVISYLPVGEQSRVWFRLSRIAARLFRSGWTPEDGDVFYPAGILRLPCYEHRFPPGEIQAECAAAGLRVVRDEEIKHWRCAVAAASTAPQTSSSDES